VKQTSIQSLTLYAVLAFGASTHGEGLLPLAAKTASDSASARSDSLPAPTAPGAQGATLTLADAEVMATSCHPALREAGARVQAAHGNWVQVGLKPNPEIGYSGTEIGDEGRAGQQGGFVSQEIVTAGKLGLNRAVAARDQAVAEQRVALTRWQVITTVRKAYFETLAAERSVKLAHELNEIASQATSVSERRLKAMDVPKTSLLQSQIESDSAALLEQQASERLSAARRRLATALGTPDQPPATLEDVFSRPLPALDYESVRGQLIENSPELAALHFAVDRARMAVERESAGKSPNVNVSAGVQHDYATQDTIANVQLSLPIPFYDRNQGAIARACGELAAAQAALEARQLAVQERLALAMRDYATARERVTKYNEKILPAAKETLDLINAGYTGGQLEYVQVYNVQQIYANKNLAYLQDLEVAWQRWAEIDGFLVGDVSADSIDRSAQTTENTGERRY
jgi:cobalt-zinc-cadmium efflux system outer membrane protein